MRAHPRRAASHSICLVAIGIRRSAHVSGKLGTSGFRPNVSATIGSWSLSASANANRIESDVLLLETIAGPILLVAVFFGTLLIGVKAVSPVELARRRQLEFSADASHELGARR